MLQFDLLTLFPDFFGSFLSESLIGKSIEKELLQVELNNFREYGIGSHRKAVSYTHLTLPTIRSV